MASPKSKLNEHLWEVQATHADLKVRHLYCFGEISEELVARLLMALLQMDAMSEDPIHLYLNSPGGSADDGMALHDAIMNARSHITVIGMGIVASAATDIFIACDKRLLTPETRFMIHDGSWSPSVPHARVVVSAGKEMAMRCKRNYERFSERSGKPVHQIKKLFENETFLSAEEAVEWGFAHEVLKPGGAS